MLHNTEEGMGGTGGMGGNIGMGGKKIVRHGQEPFVHFSLLIFVLVLIFQRHNPFNDIDFLLNENGSTLLISNPHRHESTHPSPAQSF